MMLSQAGRRALRFDVISVRLAERWHQRTHAAIGQTLATRTLIVAVELALAWGLVGLAANIYVRFGG